ncbi:hypothetical protein DPEC_G00024800 [Dallia pectoralis]|uniref:Uncharacterized protein n=1 Tax=Dallia pectoralis TaxID=75939 RepID=A0ACC2HI52_DALPE|nr:hypothetical protein DPEC_G00024800 [Dallia pectoralis]
MTTIPHLTSVDLCSLSGPISTRAGPMASTPDPWWEEERMQVHTILIVVIFSVVCFLLFVAFFYTFCFRCSLEPSSKERRSTRGCSLEREDATFCRSSSDCQSVGNVV